MECRGSCALTSYGPTSTYNTCTSYTDFCTTTATFVDLRVRIYQVYTAVTPQVENDKQRTSQVHSQAVAPRISIFEPPNMTLLPGNPRTSHATRSEKLSTCRCARITHILLPSSESIARCSSTSTSTGIIATDITK